MTVSVGNLRKLRGIWDSIDKSDASDARILGKVCRIEARMLHPLKHRSSQPQANLASIKSVIYWSRAGPRTQLITHVRGLVKVKGECLPKCSSESFARKCETLVPHLRSALKFVFKTIFHLNELIKEILRRFEQLSM